MSKAKAVFTGAERKALVLEAGAKLAAKYGSVNVSRQMVAVASKISPALVSHYMGSTDKARSAYARKARAMGLEQPSKEKQIELGAKLRAHAPKDVRDSRPRSAKEVKAIAKKKVKPTPMDVLKRLRVPRPKMGVKAIAEFKPAPVIKPAEIKPTAPKAAPKVKPAKAPAVAPASNKSAARAPKAAPPLPALLPLN